MERELEPGRARGMEAEPPAGLLYVADFLSEAEERGLLAELERLDFRPMRWHAWQARREVIHYGWSYDFDRTGVAPQAAFPPFLPPLQRRGAALAGVAPASLEQAMIARYPPGAGIGWHRDAPAFGPVVVGVSLAAPCVMRFRRSGAAPARFAVRLAPRSLYVLAGEARAAWQHSIPGVPALRYSITFRSLRRRR